MPNMSYCRFENTANDLRDCRDAMCNGEDEDLNRSEADAKRRLIELCREIAEKADEEAEAEMQSATEAGYDKLAKGWVG